MLIGSDFIVGVALKPCACSECGKHIAKGDHVLESVRIGKVQKRVCSEQCRLNFDDAFWQDRANRRERGEL
jgi:hypothetical protein